MYPETQSQQRVRNGDYSACREHQSPKISSARPHQSRVILANVHKQTQGVDLSDASSHEVTALLLAWRSGDPDAHERLFERVHTELHRIASRFMAGERPGHTLQPTALVNEAYLRLIEIEHVTWQDRAHFFAMAARVMRRILVDNARARQFQKRGGGAEKISLEEAMTVSAASGRELVALDDALAALAARDERKSRIVELKFFGGLNIDETAAVVGVSPDTVKRDLKMAKVWLLREIARA
jgi:RNA polymerase sigma-70 factor (ECF subfamily)